MKLIIILTFLAVRLTAQTNGTLAYIQSKTGGVLLTNASYQFKFGNRAFFREEETGRIYGFQMVEIHTNLLAILKLNPADGDHEQAAIDEKKKAVAQAYLMGDALAAQEYEKQAEERKKLADAEAEKKKSSAAQAESNQKKLADAAKERQDARLKDAQLDNTRAVAKYLRHKR